MTKKPSPQDSTRRNIQAANKRFAAIMAELKLLKARVKKIEKFIKGD